MLGNKTWKSSTPYSNKVNLIKNKNILSTVFAIAVDNCFFNGYNFYGRFAVKRENRTYKIVLIALFITLITVGSFIKIPTPLVPITMQLAFCLLTGVILGGKTGAIAVIIYVIMGLIGLPVFAYGGGIYYVFKPTFGYTIAFIPATFITGIIARGADNTKTVSFWKTLIACLIGIFIVYSIGVIYMYFILSFYLGSTISVSKAITSGCLIFLPTDILWSFSVSFLSIKLIPILNKRLS